MEKSGYKQGKLPPGKRARCGSGKEQAVEKAQALQVLMSLAIVDEGGHLVMLLRMDGAGWLTTDIARGKAYTAAAFRRSTAELAERLGSHPSFLSAINAM